MSDVKLLNCLARHSYQLDAKLAILSSDDDFVDDVLASKVADNSYEIQKPMINTEEYYKDIDWSKFKVQDLLKLPNFLDRPRNSPLLNFRNQVDLETLKIFLSNNNQKAEGALSYVKKMDKVLKPDLVKISEYLTVDRRLRLVQASMAEVVKRPYDKHGNINLTDRKNKKRKLDEDQCSSSKQDVSSVVKERRRRETNELEVDETKCTKPQTDDEIEYDRYNEWDLCQQFKYYKKHNSELNESSDTPRIETDGDTSKFMDSVMSEDFWDKFDERMEDPSSLGGFFEDYW